MNENQHSLFVDETLSEEAGVACGGHSIDRMLKFASIQKHYIAKNTKIIPTAFEDLAVLSPGLDKVAGRVTGGRFVSAPPPPPPPPVHHPCLVDTSTCSGIPRWSVQRVASDWM